MTTARYIGTPRNRRTSEFASHCLACGDPLVKLTDRHVPVHVHARHADWKRAPHPASPSDLPVS